MARAGEMALLPLMPRFLLDAALGCHQCLRLMGVELISEKDPAASGLVWMVWAM